MRGIREQDILIISNALKAGADPNLDPAKYGGPSTTLLLACIDSVKGAEDRSQCATTVAKMLSRGLPLTHQEVGAEILSKFDPDSLWDTLQALLPRLA